MGEVGPVGVGCLLVGGADEELEVEAGGEGGGFLGGVEEGDVGDEGRGGSVVEDVGCFVALVGGVDGDGDGADEGEAEPAEHELGAVGEEEADAVAVGDAGGLEHAGGALDGVVEVAVGDLLAGDFEEGLGGVALDDFGEEVAEGLLPGEVGGGGHGCLRSGVKLARAGRGVKRGREWRKGEAEAGMGGVGQLGYELAGADLDVRGGRGGAGSGGVAGVWVGRWGKACLAGKG